MVLAAALIGHALLEGGVGLAILMGGLALFPEITALKSYVHPHRALVRWFSLSIILQGLLAIAGLSFPRAQQRVLVLLFLSYHTALVVDGGIGYFKESSADLAASITHGVMAIILGGALLLDRTKTGSVAKTGLSKYS